MPPITNQISATSWARVIRQLDVAAWTAGSASRAWARAQGDHETLRYPLLGVAAAFHDDARQSLFADIRSGSADALSAFGNVRDLAPDVAAQAIYLRQPHAGDNHRCTPRPVHYGRPGRW